MELLDTLRNESKKGNLFNNSAKSSISYALGFPLLDQKLGAIYIRKRPDGTVYKDIHLGVPAGSFIMFCGQSSSGKTTAAIQAASNIVEPFGDRGLVIHRDGERSTGYDRVKVLTGWDDERLKKSYNIEQENNTWENVLAEIIKISEVKEAAGEAMMYKTGQYDVWGNELEHYVPTCIIIDSLTKFVSENEATDMINKLTAGPRGAIYQGNFYRNALEYMGKYNIIVFVINHMNDDMPDPTGRTKKKKMTFIPTGKSIPGADKSKLLTSSIIWFNPHTRKDDISTEEINGWNGVPTEAYVIKSRTSLGGFSVMMEFIQESGFDQRLTLMRFAKEQGIIKGRNPSCYFEDMPDVKFDTRIFLDEVSRDPQIMRALFMGCRKSLMDLIPVVDTSNDEDKIRSSNIKKQARDLMNEMMSMGDE